MKEITYTKHWNDFIFPQFIPEDERKQLIDFWIESWGRSPIEWQKVGGRGLSNNYEGLESSQRQHQNEMLHVARMDNEHEAHCLACVNSLSLEPFRDGNKWCFLWGKDLQSGIVGFGKTILDASMNFYSELNKEQS